MRKTVVLLLVVALAAVALAQDEMSEMMDDGLRTIESEQSFDDTVAAAQAAVEAAGFGVPLVLDHSANAASVDEELPPTTLIVFGNPAVGSGLMQQSRTTAIDLPQKFLIWEDMDGVVFITYNDASFLAARHGWMEMEPAIDNINNALAGFAEQAATMSADDIAAADES